MRVFLELQPTANQSFRLVSNGKRGNITARLEESYQVEQSGEFEKACQMRFDLFQDIISTLPDDEESSVELDRNHPNTLSAMETILASAVDNYLAGDSEMAAAQLELLLDCDSEDPLEATPILALCYILLEEWECLEDIEEDLGDKSAIHPFVSAIRQFATNGTIEPNTISNLCRFKEFVAELKLADHPTNEAYIRDISSERPSRVALARELYLRCEPILKQYPDFLPALITVLK